MDRYEVIKKALLEVYPGSVVILSERQLLAAKDYVKAYNEQPQDKAEAKKPKNKNNTAKELSHV